jgi:hypothetical protein
MNMATLSLAGIFVIATICAWTLYEHSPTHRHA